MRTVAESFSLLMLGLKAVIAEVAAPDRSRTAFLVFVWGRLSRMVVRFTKLYARWKAGTLPKARGPRPPRAPREEDDVKPRAKPPFRQPAASSPGDRPGNPRLPRGLPAGRAHPAPALPGARRQPRGALRPKARASRPHRPSAAQNEAAPPPAGRARTGAQARPVAPAGAGAPARPSRQPSPGTTKTQRYRLTAPPSHGLFVTISK
jgi:hypothetical protein